MDRRLVLALMAAVLIALLLPDASRPQRVDAAFPGANGKIAFVSDRGAINGAIYTMNADGSGVHAIVLDAPPVGFDTSEAAPAWSPEGSRIAFMSDRLTGGGSFVMNADGADVSWIGLIYAERPAWSPDGGRVVASSVFGSSPFSRNLFVVDLATQTSVAVAETEREEADPSWSPDGSRIAFVVGDQYPVSFAIVNADIVVANEDGTGKVNLTNSAANEFGPDWSPDGSKIAFASDVEGDFDNFEIFVMNADGSNVQQLTDNNSDDSDPVWSPDGRFIAFTTSRDGNSEVYVMDANGEHQTNVTNNPASEREPDWQPIIAGDANCQGGITPVDAAIILQYDAGLLASLPCADLADVNGDGIVNPLDAALILQYVAGLLASLPP